LLELFRRFRRQKDLPGVAKEGLVEMKAAEQEAVAT
jgi:hypothetical protein